MPKYRVKPGREHMHLGPGAIVEHTEEEAGPFMDKLELIEEELLGENPGDLGESPGDKAPSNQKSEMTKDNTIQAPGGGFEPFMATVKQVEDWLKTDPGRLQAAIVLQSERDGKKRKTVIEALEAYIKEESDGDKTN